MTLNQGNLDRSSFNSSGELGFDKRLLLNFGIDPVRLARLHARIHDDVEAGKYPGAAMALARRGQIVFEATFGIARLAEKEEDGSIIPAVPAGPETMWLLYSQTKPILASAIWLLIERGMLNLHAPVAYYMPSFAAHGKEEVTVYHLLTHQAGFPNANIPESAWFDSGLLRQSVADFSLDFAPGSKVFYHSYAAHWVMAALITVVTGEDFKTFIREEILDPLALVSTYVGVPDYLHKRLAGSYQTLDDGSHAVSSEFSGAQFYRCGMPGAGGYATAGDVALFYQMLLNLGQLNGARVLSPRMVQFATRNHTADRVDEFFGAPCHRGLGVHLRGTTADMRGLSSIASPSTFGHGGVGSSYSFACPESGVSFTYLTNARMPEPAHTRRLEEIMTMAQATINEIA